MNAFDDLILFEDVSKVKLEASRLHIDIASYVSNGVSFIGLAIAADRPELIAVACEAGARCNGEVFMAISAGRLACLRMLYALYGAGVVSGLHEDYGRVSPLAWAIGRGDVAMFAELIRLGADIDDTIDVSVNKVGLQLQPKELVVRC